MIFIAEAGEQDGHGLRPIVLVGPQGLCRLPPTGRQIDLPADPDDVEHAGLVTFDLEPAYTADLVLVGPMASRWRDLDGRARASRRDSEAEDARLQHGRRIRARLTLNGKAFVQHERDEPCDADHDRDDRTRPS